MQEDIALPQILMLGALEMLLNQAIEAQPDARKQLKRLGRVVVRIRTEKPFTVLYLLICEDGAEILHQYEGHVDVRVRAPLGALLYQAVKPSDEPHDSIRILADEDQIDAVRELMRSCNLWHALQVWLHEHVKIEELLVSLRRFDPIWFDRLQDLHTEVAALRASLESQRETQMQILNELRGLRRSLRRERQIDLLCLSLALVFLMLAMASATGLPVLLLPELSLIANNANLVTLMLAATGLTLLVSRLLFGHRYD